MAGGEGEVALDAAENIVVIDFRVPELEAPTAGAAPGEQVVALDPSRDGARQSAALLAAGAPAAWSRTPHWAFRRLTGRPSPAHSACPGGDTGPEGEGLLRPCGVRR